MLLLCLTLCDPMDCSPPGSSAHGHSPGKSTRVGCHFLLLDQESSAGLPHCRRALYRLSQQGSPVELVWWSKYSIVCRCALWCGRPGWRHCPPPGIGRLCDTRKHWFSCLPHLSVGLWSTGLTPCFWRVYASVTSDSSYALFLHAQSFGERAMSLARTSFKIHPQVISLFISSLN